MREPIRPTRRIAAFGALALVLMGLGPVPQPVPRPDTVAALPRSLFNPMLSEVPRSAVLESAGFLAIDLDSGQVIAQQRQNEAFVPASVTKLVTALYALDVFGAEHRFTTRLMALGRLASDGRLMGDLALIGGGDPELDTDQLAPMIATMKQAGIRSIEGRFLVDGGEGEKLRIERIDAEQPEDMPYNPGVSSLNLNFNRVRLRWHPGGSGPTISVTAKAEALDPPVSAIRVEPDRQAGLVHAIERTGEIWRVNSALLSGRGARWLPVRRPEAYAGDVFQGLAARSGIRLGLPLAGPAQAGGWPVAAHESRSLGEILADMLKYSTNLTAEVVGLEASRRAGIVPAGLRGSAIMMSAWASSVGGFPQGDREFRLVNHSGLSASGRISPRRMVSLLTALARRPAGTIPHPRLPGPAPALLHQHWVGTGEGDPLAGLEVRAKTGTMDFVRGLAGYAVTPAGHRFAFAIFVNDLERREAPGRPGAARWLNEAKALEVALIRNWAAELDRGASR